MTITVPWVWVEAGVALVLGVATGGLLGATVVLVRMRGERRAEDR